MWNVIYLILIPDRGEGENKLTESSAGFHHAVSELGVEAGVGGKLRGENSRGEELEGQG